MIGEQQGPELGAPEMKREFQEMLHEDERLEKRRAETERVEKSDRSEGGGAHAQHRQPCRRGCLRRWTSSISTSGG